MSTRRELALVVLIAVAVGAAWATLTPTLHGTDEQAHFAYVQAVAELGHPPREITDTGLLSDELACWWNGFGVVRVRFDHTQRPPWSSAHRTALERSCRKASREYDGAQYHAYQPPAYYALGAVGYRVGQSASLPTRFLFVRLISVLLAALTVALTYLLVRELVPGSRWPARAGALALTFQPVFMFNEATVNPDSLVVATTVAIALVAARAWRHGLTTRRSLVLGGLVGLGVVAKANFLLLLPSVAILFAALWWGSRPEGRRARGLRLLGASLVAVLCLGAYALANDLLWDRELSFRQPAFSAPGAHLSGFLSYAWQFFLPAVGFMTDLFPHGAPVWGALIEGSTSRLGWWNDYGLRDPFPLLLAVAGVVVAVAALVYVGPRARARPWPAIVVVAAACAFLGALIVADYQYSLGTGGPAFQGRYAFPLMPLWGLTVGCAVAAFPQARRPVVVGVLAVAVLAHTALAISATVSRYYL